MKKAFVIFLIILFSIFLFSNCKIDVNNNESASSIEQIKITQEPYKTKYFRGEKLDLSGLTIVAVYKDGHEETITDYTVFPSEGETLNYVGNKEVIVRKTKQGSKDRFIYFTSFYIEIEEKTKVYNPTEGFIFVEGETIVGCDEYSSQGNGVFPEGRIVHLSDFYLCDHEVTQGEYENIMGNNPSSATLKNATEGEIQKCRPVENISWYEAIVYCNRLSIKKGLTPCYIIQGIDNFETLPNSEIPTEYNENWDNVVFDSTADGYRLPTEAEWEFAARGGKKTYGTSSFKEDSGIDIALVEWNIINSDGKTHEVKLKTPNSLSFFDIGGNVHELCWDWRKEIEAEEITNPKGDKNGSKRVIRGGSFNSSLENNSFLERSGILPYDKDSSIGMRIARSISSSSSSESETNSYTINYISAYGQRPDPINLYEGNILTVRNLPELTCTGYTFMGWYASSSFEENTKISSGYTITGNLTLYAKWAKISNTESEIIQPDNAQIKLIVQKPEKSIIRVKKGDGIQLQGIISAMSGKPTLSISRQGEDDESEVQIWSHEYTDDEGEENAASGFYDYGYNHVIPETWFNQAKSQQYRLILRVSNGKTIEDEKTIIYDVDGPEISITDVKPVVELSGKEIINKTFKVKGTITDRYDNVESASWTLIKRGEGEGNDEVIDSGSDLKETFVITVDTKDYDNTDVVLIITAYDRAGNKTEVETPFHIDQSTDIPTIEPNDPATLTFDYKTKDELINGNNALIEAQGNNSEEQDVRKNFYTGGSRIIMKFTDDDGINRITVNATVLGGTEPSNITTVEAKGATEYTYAYKAPESEGYFQIDVTVTDINDASKSEKFYILVSGGTPSVKLTTSPEFITTNTDGTAPNAKKNFTIIGNNSGSAPFKYVLREINGDEDNAERLDINQYTESVEGKGDSSDRKRWVDTFTPDANAATGSVKYTIYDNYGISASETFYYKTDSIRPTSTITSCMDENTSNSGTFRFVGTAADNETGSGVASVQIRIDNYNEDDGDTLATSWAELPAASQNSTGWIDASGTENWNLLVDLSEYPNVFGAGKEGKKVLYVRVTDGVGNYNELTAFNATTKEGARKVFIYDKLDPAVSIREYTGADDGETVQLGSRNSFEIKQLFNLTGTYSDGYGIDDIEIEQTFGEDTVVIGGVNCDELNDESWSWDVENLPRSMDSPNNGQTSIVSGKYTYKVTVTDKAGKTSSENVTVTIDITPPTIGITKPIGNTTGADGSIIKNFVSGDSYMFQGTITDNENGTGIDKYYYFLTADGTIPDDTSWVYATSEENWSFTKTIASGPGAVSGSDLYEGEWTLYVKAVDKAGNESAVVSRAFSIDKAVPRLTIDGNTLSNSGTTYFKEASYTISGTAEDTHGIDYITIRSGSTVLANIAGTEITNGNWTAQLQLEENTAISISIIATDKAGRTSDTITRSFYRDTQAPSIWTTSDLTGLFTSTGSGITIQGSVNDGTGSGVDKVLYSIDGSEPSLVATVTNQTWTVNFTSANLPSEGMYILKIKAIDKLGNITAAPVTGTIVYDTAKPNLTINLNDGTSRTVTNNSSLIVSASNYGISGTFSDTGTNVTVSAGLDCSDSTAAVTITQNPATGKSGTWSLSQTRRNGTQTVTDIPDGIYEYTVTAVDEAGVYTGSSARKESVKFKVTKDTTPPVITSIAVPDRETAKITQFTFSGVTEDVTSGVASVKLTISDGTNTTVFSTDATDNSLKISGLERWSKEVVYANYPVFNTEGNKTVTVEAKDKAGKTATQTVTFIYDKANPVLTVDESTLQEYMNDQGYILNGTAADSYGLASVEIIEKYNGVETGLETITVGANNSWQVRVPLGNVTPNEGRYDYTIVAKDTAGNVTTSRNYVTYVDKTSPLIGIARPVTTALLTGAINESQASFSGSVSDPVDSNSNEVVSGIHAVWYKILARNATAPVPPASTSVALQDTAWNGWTKAIAGASLWNFNQAFEQGTTAYNAGNLPEGRYTLYVAAVDNAGMVSEVASRNFDVDMAAPTLTESSSSEFQTRVGFTLSGAVSDTHGLASLQIRDTYKDLSGIITPGNNEEMTCTSGIWAKSFVVGSSNSSVNNYLADGEHTFTVTATDIMGKTTTVRRVVTVDTAAPVVTVYAPASDTERTQINSISESVFRFDGGITENGTGIQAVWYKILPASSAAPAAPSSGESAAGASTWDGWTSATAGNTLWSKNQAFVSGTANANTGEGDKKIYVYAVDKLGNVSAPAVRAFSVDMTAPTITAWTISTGTNTIYQNGTYFFKDNLSGTATATDTRGMASSNPVKVTIDGTTVLVTPNTSGEWTLPASSITEGSHIIRITVTDIVGKTTEEAFNIYKDTIAPEVQITRPEGYIDVSPATARFSIVEDGIGIQGKVGTSGQASYVPSMVEYRLNGGAWTPTDYTSGTTVEQILDLGTNQGPMTLEVRATDKVGNTYTTPVRTFYYDYQDPVIVETDEVARYVKQTFTLTGTAYDTYRLSYIEVKDITDGNKVYRSNSNTNTQIANTGNFENANSPSTAAVWELAFTAADWAGFSEGNHVFKITAVDGSGRISETPNKNVWIDKHAPVVTSAVVPTTQLTQGASYRFSGTAKDYNNNAGTANSSILDSGIKNIEIQITNQNVAASNLATATATGWIDVTGQENWNAILAFEEYDVFDTEGVKTLHVRATDNAENISNVFTKNFVFDKAYPTLAVSTYTPAGGLALAISSTDNEPTFNVNGIFSLSGIASDTNGVKQVVITQRIGDAEPVVIETLDAAGATTFNWSTNTGTNKGLPRNPNNPAVAYADADIPSGEYTYTITITDVAGADGTITEATAKTVTKTVKAIIDKVAPVVTITNPANENANTGLNAISVVSNRFAGTASDNHEGATDVEVVWYKIIARDGTVLSAPSSSTTVDNSWTGLGFTKASNTTNWFFSQAIESGTMATEIDHICEGRYRLVVYAVDNAGNVSTPATQYFDVDMNAPAIETKLDDEVLDESMTQTKTGAYTFKYKVTETYGLAANNPVVTMRKDNVTFTGFTQSTPDANGYVTVSISSQADGFYEYTISATDLVGKNSTIRRNILLDTTPPTLTVTSPDLSGWQTTSTSVNIKGIAEDKSGTKAVWYAFGDASMPATPASNTTADASWTGNGWTKATGTTSWSFTVTGVEGTDKNLYIATVDTNGAVTTTGAISAVVKVDVTNPTLTETDIGAGTQYKNSNFTFSGTASDSGSGLASTNPITITNGTNTYHPTVTSGNWSQTIDTTSLAEGTYTYTIKVRDVAGRESTETRTIIFDKTAPDVTTKTIGSVGTGLKQTISGTDWYKTTQIPVTIVGSDNLAGVQTIECSTDHSSWNTLSKSGNDFVGTISCTSQGENTIYIRVTDNVGNKSIADNFDWDGVSASWLSANTLTVHVDTLAPDTLTLGTVGGAALEGVKLVNGREDLVFTVTASDAANGSGLASTGAVALKQIGTVVLGTPVVATGPVSNVYTITIPTANMPSVTTPVNVIVTVKDGVGNSADFTAFQLQKDNVYPLATVGTINDADKSTSTVTEVNDTITVSGTASDTNTLTGIQLQYQTSASGTSSWSDWADYTATTNTTGSYYNWSYSINTTTAFGNNFDEKYVRFRALATDEAGNTGNTGTTTQYSADNAANNKLVKVSQKTDRPVIRFTNLNLGTSTIWLKNANTLYGLISDDDGDVTSLKYKLAAAESWTTLNPVSGSGYFEITNIADGQSTFYFQAVDAAGKTFETDTAASPNTLNEPILTDGTNKIETGTVALTLKVDKTSPSVRNKQYQIFNAEQGSYGQWGNWVTENDVTTWTENAWSSSLVTLGGRYTGLKVKLEASDENAIDSVISTFGAGNTVSFTCGENHDDNAYHPWATGEITIPNNVTEVRNLEVVITDGAGLTKTEEISVEIDNSAPVITIQNPSTLIGTTETIRGNITTAHASETRDVKLYYAVSRYNATADSVKPANSGTRMDGTTVLATAWTPIESVTTSLNWYVHFDDQTSFADHTDRFAIYLTQGTQQKPYLGITTAAAIENGSYETETQLYFWLKAVDNSGNTSFASKELLVDPQGDRPTVTLSYPTNVEDFNGDFVAPILGGSIRLNGTATDNSYAKYVWVQIEKPNNFGDFDGFDAADLAFMNTNNGTVRTYGYELGKISTNEIQTIAQIDYAVSANTNISDYGIRVPVIGSSWFVIVNKEGEYSLEGFEENTQIKFTIIATDETELPGGSIKINKSHPITQIVRLDSDIPCIDYTTLRLVQYETSPGSGIACTDGSVSSGTIINEIPYQIDMSIRGIWFLKGRITDDSGFSEIVVNNVAWINSPDSGIGATSSYNNNGITLTPVPHQNNNTVCDYDFQIIIGNNSVGEVGSNEVRIFAQEAKAISALSFETTFRVIYDNLAPVFITYGNNVSLPTSIQDISGFFTFGAVATEDSVYSGQNSVIQSGVERIAFYFTRDLGYNIKTLSPTQYSGHDTNKTVTHDLFDVMISSENKDSDDESSGNIIIDYASGAVTASESNPSDVFTPYENTMKTGYKYEDKLIWQNVENCTVIGAAITVPDGTNVRNIHKGGLVKIKGSIYKIFEISGNVFIISENLTTSSTTMDVMFAIANVIDTNDRMGVSISSTKGYGYGYYTNNPLDDGDLMIESFNRQGTRCIWDACIKSTNLPDGPITLHVVAMDKAGNVSEYSYNATICNNGPRIAGMWIGTDENGNNSVDDAEFDKTTYHYIYANGKQGNNKVTNATFPIQLESPTSAIVAKGKTEIMPEIIGGNGQLRYTYDVYYRNYSDSGWNTTADYSESIPRNLGMGEVDSMATLNNNITLNVEDFVKTFDGMPETQYNPSRIQDGNNRKFVFHIGDTTPALSESGNSQNATLNVIMDVAIRDTNPARNYIIPFYWKRKPNSSNEVVSSLFKNSREQGHIELPKDWVYSEFYRPYDENDTTDTIHLFDQDPKVSGKIKIEGIAQDDVLLKDITLKFNKSFVGTNGFTADTPLTIASYNNGTWTYPVTGTNLTNEATGTINTTTGWSANITQATYGDLLAANIINELPTIGNTTIQFVETDLVPYSSQDYGHVVHWTLYLDTAMLSTIAATEVTLEATATDRGNPTWNGSEVVYTQNNAVLTTSTYNTGYTGAVTTTGSGDSFTVSTNDFTGKLKMDIVPYITKVTTALTNKLSSKMKAAYSRTVRGHYIARSDETITITGFNLGDNSTHKPRYNDDITLSGSTGTTVGLPVSNIAASGEVYLTVNGVETFNNMNNNNSSGQTNVTITEASSYDDKNNYAYNRMPNRKSNNLLTDDVVVDVWEFDSDAAIPTSGELSEPIMKINPVNGTVGVAFVSGPGDFAMPGNTSETGVSANGASSYSNNSINENSNPGTKDIYSYSLWQNNYEKFNSIALAFDENGYAHATATGLDTNTAVGTKHVGRFSYFYNRWGRSGNDATGNYRGDKAIRLESITVPAAPGGGGFSMGGYDNVKLLINGKDPELTDTLSPTRFSSPSIATTVSGDTTSVYLAYYDSIQKQIRFRYNSAVKSTWARSGSSGTYYANYSNDVDQFVDNLVRIDKSASASSNTTVSDYDVYMATKGNASGATSPSLDYQIYYESKTQYFSLIAGVDYQQGTLRSVDDYGNTSNCLTGYNTGYSAGKYVAIDAIGKNKYSPAKDNDIVVAVWYDGTSLRYAYNDNPASGLDNGNANGWKGNKPIFANGGEHCAIKVDPNKGIHIAAYANNTLRYAYLPTYDYADYDEETDSVIVDSFVITGERITIDAGLELVPGTSTYVVIPYISYYNSTARLPAVAHPVAKTAMDYTTDGTDSDDIFTGDWEVSLVPTSNSLTINYNDKINLALWKNGSGNIVASNDSYFASSPIASKSSANNESTESCGHIYGNRTSNPIMGYAIESTFGSVLETAQKR